MRISLVIPAYNEEAHLGACLESVLAQGTGVFAEIIVVDNMSTDKTVEIARSYPGVTVVSEESRGPTRARERGRKVARSELLAYIDADTRLPAHWAEKIQEHFKDRPNLVSLSGPARYFDANTFEKIILTVLWQVSLPVSLIFHGYVIYGANMVVRKKAMNAAGGFNRAVDFYGDETELALRLRKQGAVLFKQDFFIYGSVRRFREEGFLKTSFLYALNFIWPILFGHPYTKTHTDVRAPSI